MIFQAKTNRDGIYNFEIVDNRIWCTEIHTPEGFDQIDLSANFQLARSAKQGVVYLSDYLYSNGLAEEYIVEWVIDSDTYNTLFRPNSPIKVSKPAGIIEKRNDDGSYSIQLPKRYALKIIISIPEEKEKPEFEFFVVGKSIEMPTTSIKGANCLQITTEGFTIYSNKRGPIMSSPTSAKIINLITDIPSQELDKLIKDGVLLITDSVRKTYFSTPPVVGPSIVRTKEK